MSDFRIVHCDACGGDGCFEWCDGSVGGEPHYAGRTCSHCGGAGEEEIEVFPIELADLEERAPLCGRGG